MKKLGLIGGTGPESTLIYYQKICQQVYQDTGLLPPLNIESLSVYQVLKLSEKHEFDKLTNYLVNGINNLEKAGAQFAALTGITPHIVFDQVQSKVNIPLVSIPSTLRNYAVKQNLKRLVLLGTAPTMSQHFVQDAFKDSDIDIVVPKIKDQNYIGEKIEAELEKGIVKEETQHQFVKIINQMINENKIDGIILGCTELPLAFNNLNLPIDILDAMEIHIKQLISMIENS